MMHAEATEPLSNSDCTEMSLWRERKKENQRYGYKGENEQTPPSL